MARKKTVRHVMVANSDSQPQRMAEMKQTIESVIRQVCTADEREVLVLDGLFVRSFAPMQLVLKRKLRVAGDQRRPGAWQAILAIAFLAVKGGKVGWIMTLRTLPRSRPNLSLDTEAFNELQTFAKLGRALEADARFVRIDYIEEF